MWGRLIKDVHPRGVSTPSCLTTIYPTPTATKHTESEPDQRTDEPSRGCGHRLGACNVARSRPPFRMPSARARHSSMGPRGYGTSMTALAPSLGGAEAQSSVDVGDVRLSRERRTHAANRLDVADLSISAVRRVAADLDQGAASVGLGRWRRWNDDDDRQTIQSRHVKLVSLDRYDAEMIAAAVITTA